MSADTSADASADASADVPPRIISYYPQVVMGGNKTDQYQDQISPHWSLLLYLLTPRFSSHFLSDLPRLVWSYLPGNSQGSSLLAGTE